MPPPEKRQRTLVKICGVRSPALAQLAFEAGADAVGVVIAQGSPRAVSPGEALRISQVQPDRVVLVLRDPDAETLDIARIWAGPVQFHHPFPAPQRRHVEAASVGSAPSPSPNPRRAAWLLDAPAAGSGEAWAWPASASLPTDLPVILAGGLEPSNVAEAIRRSLPWAVDVSSGVERERGVKDPVRVRAFLQAVRDCDLADGRTLQPCPAGFDALR